MKKLLFIACLLAATFCAQAQTNGSFVVRSGNTYSVDGQSLDKVGFMHYLQSHDQVIYQDFSKAYKLSNTGWGLFGAGLGLEAVGVGVVVGEMVKAAILTQEQKLTPEQAAKEVATGVVIGELLTFVGGALDLSGIVCLGVGYGRMHKAADIYNVKVQQGIKAEFRPASSGLGMALAW